MRTKPLVKTLKLGKEKPWFIWECDPCEEASNLLHHTLEGAFNSAWWHARRCTAVKKLNQPHLAAVAIAGLNSSFTAWGADALEIEQLYNSARALGMTHNQVTDMLAAAKEAAEAGHVNFLETVRTFINIKASGKKLPEGKVTIIE